MFSFYLLGFKKTLSFLKKVLIVVVVYFVVASLFLHFINKDRPKINYDPVQKNREKIYKLINDPQLKKTEEGKIAIALYRAMLCGLIGEACTNNPKDADKNFNNSFFGIISNLISIPYTNPPASGVYWAYSGLQNAGFVPKTYAAEGIGLSSIRPIISIWKTFRDFSYAILVVVIIAIGFMIMFRTKINAQTVITVENSLPKIVIALLLITFSFAVVGFLIDLMYILIALSISLIDGENNLIDKFTNAITSGPLSLSQEILSFNFYNAAQGLIGLFPVEIKTFINLLTTALSIYLLDFITIGKISDLPKAFNSITGVGSMLAFFIKTVIVFATSPFISAFFIQFLTIFTAIYLYFRIFFLLLINYIELLIYIIFSPLILMFESVPGRSAFSFWFKKIFFSIFTFYLVFVLLKVTKLISNIMLTPTTTELWRPPFIYNIDYQYFPPLVVLGILFIIPNIVNLFKQIIGVKDVGVGFSLGTLFAGAGAAYGGAMGGLGAFTSLYQAPVVGKIIRKLDKKNIIGKLMSESTDTKLLRGIAKKMEVPDEWLKD